MSSLANYLETCTQEDLERRVTWREEHVFGGEVQYGVIRMPRAYDRHKVRTLDALHRRLSERLGLPLPTEADDDHPE